MLKREEDLARKVTFVSISVLRHWLKFYESPNIPNRMEMPYPESGPCSDCTGEASTSQDEIVVLSSLVEEIEAEEGSRGYVTPPVENSDLIPLQVHIHTVLEKAAEHNRSL